MRKLSAAVLTSVLILFLASTLTPSYPFPASTLTHSSPAPTIEDCSCTASDGSCSASISCPNGECIANCLPQNDCLAECSGFYQMLGMETTLQLQNGTYPQLVAELARISRRDVAFSPLKPDVLVNADYKRAVLWDVLDLLSDRGTVRIAGRDFERLKRLRRSLLSGTRISLCVGNTPVHTFVNDMAGLTGLPLRITAGRPMAMVNVKLQDVTLDDILVKVSEQTGTKIIEEGVGPGGR